MALRDKEPHVWDYMFDGVGIWGKSSGNSESDIDGSFSLPLLVGKIRIFLYFLRGGDFYGRQQDTSEPEDLHDRENKDGRMTGS